ncbi:hypothetical protein [Bacteroides heparinolyticus]
MRERVPAIIGTMLFLILTALCIGLRPEHLLMVVVFSASYKPFISIGLTI